MVLNFRFSTKNIKSGSNKFEPDFFTFFRIDRLNLNNSYLSLLILDRFLYYLNLYPTPIWKKFIFIFSSATGFLIILDNPKL